MLHKFQEHQTRSSHCWEVYYQMGLNATGLQLYMNENNISRPNRRHIGLTDEMIDLIMMMDCQGNDIVVRLVIE